ncbi:MAG: type II secretion system F family protein [Verrucomicrobiae bacterium]|nr:type II secretion system F family protein [Verrucomicrobiae bacterium]
MYSYIGIDRWGRNVTGKMAAEDEVSLEEKLHALGLWLVEAKREKEEKKKRSAIGGFLSLGGSRRRELINFCTLMAFQLRVGIPMVTALQLAAEDCENERFKVAILELKRLVEAGEQLCEAMEKFPGFFTPQFTSLVRAGEQSSTLPETFLEQKRFLEWQEQIISDVRQATVYPTIVLIVVCLFVLLLFTFVIPKFVLLLKAANAPLPTITKVVFGVSDFAKATWWIWVGILVFVPALVQGARKISEDFAVAFDKFKFKLPVFGQLNHMLVISQFAHTLSMLYRSGVLLTSALKLCRDVVKSAWLSRTLVDVYKRVEAGDSLSEAMRKHDVYPQLLVRMVVMGEKTGSLDQALENVADYYNTIIPRRVKKVFSVIEPSLIILLVGIVGTVAVAIFLPIISLMGSIR